MKVLLLNPPGRRPYVRDYLCSKTSKADYVYHPIDLVLLSGTLAEEHELAVLDCIAEGCGPERARQRIDAFAPDAIVSLVGSVCWPEDKAFLAEQAARGRRVLVTGDLLHENSEALLAAEPWIEAALHDFASPDAARWLAGEHEAVESMTVRRGDTIERISRGARKGSYRVPRPRHELFTAPGYRFPFARKRPFATVLTDHGCPYPCSFCVMSTLGFRQRPLADVLDELDHLRARGVREIFFLDQTFGVVRERALELCGALARRGDLSFTAFARPDSADDVRLAALRRAGCHTLILGVESASDEILAAYEKGYRVDEARAAVARARAHGLRTVGTFVIGLPEESEETLAATLALALELELDFMSLNVAVPRFGTPFRERALALGLASADELVMDQEGASVALPTLHLDRAGVDALKRRMVRRFYLRPSFLWRRLRGTRGWGELLGQARAGLALLARNA